MNTDAVPEDDERPSDRTGGADAGWSEADQSDLSWAQAIAPDDISELSRDVQAYHREQRSARRQQRYGRLALGPTSAPLTLTVAALALVAVVATLLTVMGPRPAGSPSAERLAITTVADGKVGGLLPAVSLLDANHQTVAARALRPAVLAVVPPGCGCSDDVHAAATSAGTQNIPLYAVVPAGQSVDGDSLTLQSTAILSDTDGALTKAIGPNGLTLVLVNRNGMIYRIYPSADSVDTRDLPSNLQSMLRASA